MLEIKEITMNAKNEFINHIGSRKVTCSEITFGDSYSDNVNNFNLTLGWTDEDWAAFMIYMEKSTIKKI